MMKPLGTKPMFFFWKCAKTHVRQCIGPKKCFACGGLSSLALALGRKNRSRRLWCCVRWTCIRARLCGLRFANRGCKSRWDLSTFILLPVTSQDGDMVVVIEVAANLVHFLGFHLLNSKIGPNYEGNNDWFVAWSLLCWGYNGCCH